MGLFEQQPLLLVPLILTVVIAYDAAKWLIRRTIGTDRTGNFDAKR